MRYVYPAVFHSEDEGGYSIYFPDIARGATQGENVAECIAMAEDFLCMALYGMEEAGNVIPPASHVKDMAAERNDIVTLISVDTDDYRRYYDNRLIKKTLNIPMWLNHKAEAADVNFSKVLQKALKEELKLTS